MAKRIGKGILGNPDATYEEIRLAIGEGIYAAMREHKRLGVPAATMIDGKVVLIPPEEIVIPDEYLEDDEPATKPTNGTPSAHPQVPRTE
jgi:hypothetical protein